MLGKALYKNLNKFSTIGNRQFATNAEAIAVQADAQVRYYDCYPAVLEKGSGVNVWDVEGKEYLDFSAGNGSVNQGHCHPRITKAAKDQVKTLTQMSRSYLTDKQVEFSEYINELLDYDQFLPMNSGTEANETAVKIARKYAHTVKGVEEDHAVILLPENSYWGKTMAALSSSTCSVRREGFGPFTPGFDHVAFNDLSAVEAKFKSNSNIAGFLYEPIQAFHEFDVATAEYLKGVRALCDKYDVIMMANEVTTGLGRTGKLMAYEHVGIKPDVVCLGKSLSGGVMAVSGVAGWNKHMDMMNPGSHGSTFGGSPLGMEVALESVKVIVDEKLSENAHQMGEIFRSELEKIKSPLIKEVRGQGLLQGLKLNAVSAKKFTHHLGDNGLLSLPVGDSIAKFTPALIINEEQIMKGVETIKNTLHEIENGIHKDDQ